MATKNGTTGNNTLNGTASADRLNGLAGNDRLNGLAGNDTLDGGSGNDTMTGGAGNDIYLVSGVGDRIHEVEGAGSGTDTVLASFSYDLTNVDHVENLTLQGANAINGTGNSLHNVITGNNSANVLNGGGGNDTLSGAGGNDTLSGGAGNDSTTGGSGDDTHVVAQAGDVIREAGAGGGRDTVTSATLDLNLSSYANVEDAKLTGSLALDATGSAGANLLTGNGKRNALAGSGGNDTLDGGAAADSLNGGTGNDVLIWDAADAVRDGGESGTDTLRVTGNVAVSLAGESIENMNVIDLAGDNTLTVTAGDIAGGFDDATLTVKGGANDFVNAGTGWTRQIDSGDYAVYTQGDVTLRVDTDINTDGIGLAPPPSSLDLGTLDGNNGFRVDGINADDHSSRAVASAGDVNGDGYDDLIIGARGANNPGDDAGESYVVFGGPDLPDSIPASSLDGTNGFTIFGVSEGDFSGRSVASAGDFNGDGYADLVIAAPTAGGASGEAYVLFGAGSFSSSVDLGALDGTTGIRLHGTGFSEINGISVASAGDVNGDGYDDLLVGAHQADDAAGEVYVVYGGTGLSSSIDLGALNGSNGFRIDGAGSDNMAGFSIASAGDLNGDGQADLLIGASGVGGNGAAYVVFSGQGFGSSLNLAALDGTNGFRLDGQGGVGGAVDSGDVNGDGRADLIIGASAYSGFGTGATFVVFGKDSFASIMNLATLDGTSGFRVDGIAENDHSGYSVAAVGDVNGDGYGDFLVGAPNADRDDAMDAGQAYLVFGGTGFGSSMSLSSLDGANGFLLEGVAASDVAGIKVAAAGDVDGDGFADVIVGAYGVDTYTGTSYVVYGRDFTHEVDFLGGAGNDLLDNGTADAERFVGGQGNDTLVGGGGADVFHGGAGDDRIVLGADQPMLVDGGSGMDVLAVDALGATISLDGTDASVTGIEGVDLSGSHANTLSLTATGVLNASGTSNALVISGDANDKINLAGVWTQIAGTEIEGQAYHQYVQGQALVQVDTDINQSGIIVADLSLDALNGENGFRLDGAERTHELPPLAGGAVASAGDINGDGYEDILVGSMGADYAIGATYVVFGGEGGFDASLDLSALDGTNGFKIGIEAEGEGPPFLPFVGFSVASAGDVDNDGFGDLIFGVPGIGVSSVIFGASSFSSVFDLSSPPEEGTLYSFGAGGPVFEGGLDMGSAVGAVDLNGDGFTDIVVGSPGFYDTEENSGAAFVVFGGEDRLGLPTDLEGLDGTNGFAILGFEEDGFAGVSVANAGDVNGDGIADLIIGANAMGVVGFPFEGPGGASGPGSSYVVFGRQDLGGQLSLSNLDGTNGFRINGVDGDVATGTSVASAGDINGDGFADLIIGAHYSGEYAEGASYVVFGGQGFGANLELSTIDGTSGFRIFGGEEYDRVGFSVRSAGDVNGDGYDDLIIGAPGKFSFEGPENDAGAAYVVFGAAGGFGSSFDLDTLDGENGFRLSGPEGEELIGNAGNAVSSAGDVNGDGFDDLVIGAYHAHGGSFVYDHFSGSAYVVFGRDFSNVVDALGGTGNDSLTGSTGDDVIVGGRGNDTMIGAGGDDVFHGGAGNDRIVIGDNGFLRVDGGSGNDTLLFGATFDLDLIGPGGPRISGIEAVDMRGNGDAEFALTVEDLLELSDTSNTLTIRGDVGDTVFMQSAGMWDGQPDEGDFNVWILGAATLKVHHDIAVTLID